MLERDVRTRLGKGHIRLRSPQLDRTPDVPGKQVGDLLLFLSGHRIDGCYPFLVPCLRILEVLSFCQLSGHHLEICHLTEMRLDCSLIYEQGCRSILLAFHLNAALCHGFPFGRGRGHLYRELHDTLHSDIPLCGKTEHRQHITGLAPYSYSLPDFVFSQGTGLEEFLHERIVILGGPFYQGCPELFGFRLVLFRNLEILAGAVFIGEMVIFHLQDIYEPVEGRTGVHRELD